MSQTPQPRKPPQVGALPTDISPSLARVLSQMRTTLEWLVKNTLTTRVAQTPASGGMAAFGANLFDSNGNLLQVVGPDQIQPEAVNDTHLAQDSVNEDHIQGGAINETHIAGGAVGAEHIRQAAIDDRHVNDDRNLVLEVDPNHRALIDFSQGGHTSKILDNIGDGATYARVKTGNLSGGNIDLNSGSLVNPTNNGITSADTKHVNGKLASDVQGQTDTYLVPLSRGTLLVASGAAAAWLTIATIPGSGASAIGAFKCKVGVNPAGFGNDSPIALELMVHATNTSFYGALMTAGKFNLINNFRIVKKTSDGSCNLELNITGGTANNTYTIEVQPIPGGYDPLYVPVAVTNGGATTGSVKLSVTLANQKSGIYDNNGAQIEHNNDGTISLFGNSFTNSLGQITNSTRLAHWLTYGVGALCTAAPLTSTAVGNINLEACTYRRGDSSHDLSFNAVSHVTTGLSTGDKRYIWHDNTDGTGGTKTWTASANANTATNGDNRICVGQSAPIPASTSSSGGAYGSGAGACVGHEMWIDERRQAKDLWWGSRVTCSDGITRRVRPTSLEVLRQAVRLIGWLVCPLKPLADLRLGKPEMSLQSSCRIEADGVLLICSAITPFDEPEHWDGPTNYPIPLDPDGVLRAQTLFKHPILRAHDMTWTPVTEVEFIGLQAVAHIHLGGHSYPAGFTPDMRGFSHNTYKP